MFHKFPHFKVSTPFCLWRRCVFFFENGNNLSSCVPVHSTSTAPTPPLCPCKYALLLGCDTNTAPPPPPLPLPSPSPETDTNHRSPTFFARPSSWYVETPLAGKKHIVGQPPMGTSVLETSGSLTNDVSIESTVLWVRATSGSPPAIVKYAVRPSRHRMSRPPRLGYLRPLVVGSGPR